MTAVQSAADAPVATPIGTGILTGKNAGIAKILIAPGARRGNDRSEHAGMGIVIDCRHVMTCAHVVNTALGRPIDAQDKPTDPVPITFPLIRGGSVNGTVVEWKPPHSELQDDIAVLEIAAAVPREAGIATLARVTGINTDSDAVSVYGTAAGEKVGNHSAAKLMGSTSSGWVQFDGTNALGASIQGGFSGAAVWDDSHAAVLGMTVRKKNSDTVRIAYMIPTVVLKSAWPKLEVEHRTLSSSFARSWTVFSSLFFLFVLAHFAVNTGVPAFRPLALYGGEKHLAAFWGMHIYGFLAPGLLVPIIRFASAFRLHDWYQRVPSFGSFQKLPVSVSTPRTAAAVLLFLIILPLVAQLHFLDYFHNKGTVYIHVNTFGYTAAQLMAAGETCDTRTVHYCTKKEAGRYSLAAPGPNGESGFWDNAYHYGYRESPEGASVTFWPILQPVVIIVLTAVNAVLSAVALYLVFRPARRCPAKPERGSA